MSACPRCSPPSPEGPPPKPSGKTDFVLLARVGAVLIVLLAAIGLYFTRP